MSPGIPARWICDNLYSAVPSTEKGSSTFFPASWGMEVKRLAAGTSVRQRKGRQYGLGLGRRTLNLLSASDGQHRPPNPPVGFLPISPIQRQKRGASPLSRLELVFGRLVPMNDQSQTGAAWDFERALANVDGYVEDLRDLLEIWLRLGPELLSDIRQALGSDDAQRLHLAAHTMKGSLQILGARCAASAAELEALAQTGQTTGGSEWLARLDDELQTLNPLISSFLKTGRAS